MARDSRRQRFEAEVLPHLDAMHRTAMRLTRNASDADDLVQDSAVKAYRFFDSYEDGTNVRAWLLKILTNVYFSKRRRSTLEGNLKNLGAGDPVSDGWISSASMAPRREPERVAERPFIEAMVNRALDELPEDFRTVLVLVDIEGLTYREVADAMGCPTGTVMSRLHRARRAVAVKLGVEPLMVPSTAPTKPSVTPSEVSTEVAEVVSLDAYRHRRREALG